MAKSTKPAKSTKKTSEKKETGLSFSEQADGMALLPDGKKVKEHELLGKLDEKIQALRLELGLWEPAYKLALKKQRSELQTAINRINRELGDNAPTPAASGGGGATGAKRGRPAGGGPSIKDIVLAALPSDGSVCSTKQIVQGVVAAGKPESASLNSQVSTALRKLHEAGQVKDAGRGAWSLNIK